ncbi:hypothetical protein RHMOL_Rhmol06G0004800 [Rhododendron molle]|uniref:Uncharacterized protein n=1 Tax=Rhododendron molle TaxID=49168 RepID=A0ACC0N9E6_RHOML|nr:hypothetical protein RHMOL_Rhmol06G0004800 [Rhododendron molle]
MLWVVWGVEQGVEVGECVGGDLGYQVVWSRFRMSLAGNLYLGPLWEMTSKMVTKVSLIYQYILHTLMDRPPGYAFVEVEESRDAEDAIRGCDGYDFDGNRLRVALAHEGRGHSSSIDRYSSQSNGRGSRGGVSKRSEYRVLVTGLPSFASWQDLKVFVEEYCATMNKLDAIFWVPLILHSNRGLSLFDGLCCLFCTEF